MTDNDIIVATFVAYLVAVIAIGVVAWRRTSSLRDYILGGRSLGKWVTALSAQASDMSGWLLLGLPGYAYLAGLESVWLLSGLLIGTYLNWKFVAERLRHATERYGDALTLPDYLESRFDDHSRLLRLVSGVFILVFFTFYTSSGLVAGGKLFESVFGLPYLWAVTAGGATVVVYTFFGGFLAVSWTDFLQGSLMFLALIAVTAVGLHSVGGLAGLGVSLENANPNLLDPFTTVSGSAMSWIAIVSLLGWGLGYCGQPHILARFMAIRKPQDIGAARMIAMGWVCIALVAATLVGLVGIGLVGEPLEGAASETVFMVLARLLFHPVVAGVCLAGILAAVMSTADSQLLVASSAVSEDFYKGLWRPNAGQGELLWVGRLAVVAISLVAFYLARDPNSKVLDLVAYAWAGFGAAFGPAIVLSLYWNAMTRNGALAGIVGGGLTVIVWKQLDGGLFDLYEIVPGAVVSIFCIVLFSKLGHRSS